MPPASGGFLLWPLSYLAPDAAPASRNPVSLRRIFIHALGEPSSPCWRAPLHGAGNRKGAAPAVLTVQPRAHHFVLHEAKDQTKKNPLVLCGTTPRSCPRYVCVILKRQTKGQ